MKSLLPIAAALTVGFASCSKDDTQLNYNNGGGAQTLQAVYTSLAPRATKAGVSVSSGGSVRAQGGSLVIFPANAYQDAAGKPVSGAIDVEVTDWLSRGDMLFGKVLPVTASGEALESGGQVFIQATQNGAPVYLRAGKSLQVNVPQFGTPVPGRLIFVGDRVTSATNTVGWRLPRLDSAARSPLVYNGDTLSIYPDSFGFYNCDKFRSMPGGNPDFNLKATAAAGRVPDEMVTYTMFRDFRGIMGIGNLKASGNRIDFLPKQAMHIVVMGTLDGGFLGGVMEITPEDGKTYTVRLEKTEPQQFKAKLNSL